jgi:hypothetical protein
MAQQENSMYCKFENKKIAANDSKGMLPSLSRKKGCSF